MSVSGQYRLINLRVDNIGGRQDTDVTVLCTGGVLDFGIKVVVQDAVGTAHLLLRGTAGGTAAGRVNDMDVPGLVRGALGSIHGGLDYGVILIVFMRNHGNGAGVGLTADRAVACIHALFNTGRILRTGILAPAVSFLGLNVLALCAVNDVGTMLVVKLAALLGFPFGNGMAQSNLYDIAALTDRVLQTGRVNVLVLTSGLFIGLITYRALFDMFFLGVGPRHLVTVRLTRLKGSLILICQTAHAGVVISSLLLAGSFCTQIVRGSYLLVIVMGCNVHMLVTADAGMVVDVILVIHDPLAGVGSMTQCLQIVMAADETVACRDTGSLTARVQALGALVDSRTAFTVTAEVVLRISRVYAVGIQIPPVAQRISGLVNMILRLRLVAASTAEIILGRLRTGCFTCHIIITDDQLIKHVRLFIQTRRANLAEVVVVCGIGIDPLIAASMPQSFTYVKGQIRIMPAFAGFVILGRGGTGCLPCIVFRTDNLLCILMISLALVIDHITD